MVDLQEEARQAKARRLARDAARKAKEASRADAIAADQERLDAAAAKAEARMKARMQEAQTTDSNNSRGSMSQAAAKKMLQMPPQRRSK